MNIEDTVTKNRVTYIYSLGYDSNRHQLTILCCQLPDLSIIVRYMLFRGISGYTDIWDELDIIGDYDLDSIIGLDTYFEATGTRYVLRTESRKISFTTALPPEIVENCVRHIE